MAKRKNTQINSSNISSKGSPSGKRSAPAVGKQQKPTVQDKGSFIKRYEHLLMPAAIALITWLFLNVCLDNKITAWDDPGYIRDNPFIKNISPEGLKAIFSLDNPVMGNYHPLTILSYAIEYSYARLDPWLYHLDSLLFHILVTVLVYWLVNLLTRRPIAAAITSLLFGLHPMHVESVAWLAGRKDVIYGAFYIAACIAYVYYIRAESAKRKWLYVGVILLFVCSLLSKPVAVTLPVTLLLIDYFEKRKLTYWLLVEKIPHFAIAILFGIKSVFDQQKFGALDTQNTAFSFIERIPLGCYALFTYLWKAIAPAHLSSFYPYPDNEVDSVSLFVSHSGPFRAFASTILIYPLLIISIIFVVWKLLRKNRIVMFGLLFFLANILLLLQFIPVGAAIVADRYSYIPYIGLFFIVGWYVSGYFEPGAKKQLAYPVLIVTLTYTLFLGYLSNERCKVWYDTTSLWRDQIEKYPRTPNAYNDLGFEYFNKFNRTADQNEKKLYYDSSYYLLNKAIQLQPTFVNSYVSLGELLRSTGQFPEAKKNYYQALSLKTDDKKGEIYLGLAIVYAINRNFDSSNYCFREALSIKPYFPEAHSNYGNLYDMLGRRDSALVQYGIAIAQNPDNDQFHLNRGRTLMRLGRWDEAMSDFQQAIAINPGLGDNYYARSFCYSHSGNKTLALQDVQKAMSLGFNQVDRNYVQGLQR